MDFESIRQFALSLPHATEDIKWEHDLCFCIGEKMFLVTGVESGKSWTIKVTPEEFGELTERPGIEVAHYIGRYKWITVNDMGVWNKEEWEHYIRQSYDLVYSKLPKKVRDALAGQTQ